MTGGTSNVTSYVYDDTGSRIIKKGRYGEVLYVNSNYTVRNNDLISSHIYAGNTRVATRLAARQERNGTYTDVLKGIYYYHGDHLGSSSVVTQTTGGFHEHLEYFPYGETWVQDKVSGGASTGLSDHELPYRYTAKEQDTETGLYYYGARYYDPQVGYWNAVDPALLNGRYFPKPNDFDSAHDYYWQVQDDEKQKLPGMGGVFNAVNMNVYQYGGLNPMVMIDPDGNVVKIYVNEDYYILPYVKAEPGTGTPVAVSRGFSDTHKAVDSYPVTARQNRFRFSQVAPADGIVEDVGYSETAGNYVVIFHGYDKFGNKITTQQDHFSSIADGIKPGVKVQKDRILGQMGDTGNSPGMPHSHYEIRSNGKLIDPKNIDIEKIIVKPATN